jgi:hypothetical protein
MTLLAAAAAAGFGMAGDGAPDSRIAALAAHVERHPELSAADVYKFLHQGVFGPGHMISDRGAAESYLDREVKSLGEAAGDEPLCEPLGGSPHMVRIHLRPFLAAGLDTGALVECFVASANRVAGDPAAMDRALVRAVKWLEAGGKIALAANLEALRFEHQPQGFPALHHGDAYRNAYHPAYRVVSADLAHENGWCD